MVKFRISLLFLTLCIPAAVYAADFPTAEDRAQWGLAQTLIAQKNHAAAEELLDELAADFANNTDLLRRIAYSYKEINAREKALNTFNGLTEPDPEDRLQVLYLQLELNQPEAAHQTLAQIENLPGYGIDHQMDIIAVAARLEDYDLAIRLCRQVLEKDPEQTEARLWLARALSWQQNYEASLQQYEKLIASAEQKDEFLREKARVLGWMNAHAESLKTYAAIDKNQSPAAAAERQAKKAYYKQHYLAARPHYRHWLELEPDNLEALFELAQIESRLGAWKQASELYRRVLRLEPHHRQALKARAKINSVSGKIRWRSEFGFLEADSAQRLSDIRAFYLSNQIHFPIEERLQIELSQHLFHYSFSGLQSVVRQQWEFAAVLRPVNQIKTVFAYRLNAYSDDIETSHKGFASIDYQLSDWAGIYAQFDQRPFIANHRTLQRHITRSASQIGLRLKPHRYFQTEAAYQFGDYSDGNNRRGVLTDTRLDLFLTPKRLSLGHVYQNYGFDRADVDYFSPSSFHFHKVYAEWQHDLGDDAPFWGRTRTYYLLRYGVHLEANDQRGHELAVQWHYDLNTDTSFGMNWRKLIYEDRDIYDEDRWLLQAEIAF